MLKKKNWLISEKQSWVKKPRTAFHHINRCKQKGLTYGQVKDSETAFHEAIFVIKKKKTLAK